MFNQNLRQLGDLVSADRPLVGIEPSAVLGFRDEAIGLAKPELQDTAERLAPHCLVLDEFIAREARAGRIGPDAFTDRPQRVRLHGHCFQKALAGIEDSVAALSLPPNYQVDVIPSGCCGMAGAFGYGKDRFDLSMKIGERALFPAVRSCRPTDVILAPGTSCRHQIVDGTQRRAWHPIQFIARMYGLDHEA